MPGQPGMLNPAGADVELKAEGGEVFRETPESQADEICRSMQELREELDDDVHQIKRSAATLADWHYYIRNYPWASMGTAALVGYLLVPRKLEIESPDAKTLEKLAKKHRLVVEHQPAKQASQGGLQTAASFLTGLVVKAAMSQAVHHLANSLNPQDASGTSVNAPDSRGYSEVEPALERGSLNGE